MAEDPQRRDGLLDIAIIRNPDNGNHIREKLELELDRALYDQVKTIIIGHAKFGVETAKWISIGNCLYKVAIASSIGCLALSFLWPAKVGIIFPLGTVSLLCGSIYMVSWTSDPCSNYRVEDNIQKLSYLPLADLDGETSVILVHTDETKKRIFHNALVFITACVCGWKIYKWYVT